jgi:hypothetical protein
MLISCELNTNIVNIRIPMVYLPVHLSLKSWVLRLIILLRKISWGLMGVTNFLNNWVSYVSSCRCCNCSWYVGRGWSCSLDRNKCERIVTVSTREYIWDALMFPFTNSAVVSHRLHAFMPWYLHDVWRTGENISDVREVSPKMYECPGHRNPVALYELYASKRPTGMRDPSDPFYIATRTSTFPYKKKLI